MGLSTVSAFAPPVDLAKPGTSQAWLLEALADSRKQAQLLADMAYEAWGADPSGVRYDAYRMAQDHADALADDLAQLAGVLRATHAVGPT